MLLFLKGVTHSKESVLHLIQRWGYQSWHSINMDTQSFTQKLLDSFFIQGVHAIIWQGTLLLFHQMEIKSKEVLFILATIIGMAMIKQVAHS